ncbi:MAG: glycosyltransferase family 39 protein [Alphaproteobacteria bacterium]|nr:glycosyltransferase family 39 protein [Alphaproteobacteria bacterium]
MGGLGKRTGDIVQRPSVVLAVLCFALHAAANGNYGIFRDELYFIVCGQHPAWGYVDQPPLAPLIATWSHALFGDFLWGFRLPAALAMTATVALTAEFTREIGGGRFAQWLAGLCVLFAPVFLIQGVLVSTDMFQALTWLALTWCLVRLEKSGNERWWIAFGAITGFCLMTKYLGAFFLVAIAIGLLATPQRRSLLRPWVYLGALLAGVMVLPNVLWQAGHGWPFLELGKAGASGKNTVMSPLAFLVQQLILIGPLAALVWASGLWAGAVKPKLAVGRAVAIAWVVLLIVFDLSHGKAYYPAAIYPALLAFGAQRIEAWFAGIWVRRGVLAAFALVGAAAAPLTLPVLPIDMFLRYQAVLGFQPSAGENLKQGVLPQYYADMFGWHDLAAKIAAVYWSLPPNERMHAVFFGRNYGEAAAIDVLGRRLGLPPAISGHNNYFLWGPRGHDGSVIIEIGCDRSDEEKFRSVSVVGRTDNPYAMPYETDQPICVLRGLKVPLQTYWPKVKMYI